MPKIWRINGIEKELFCILRLAFFVAIAQRLIAFHETDNVVEH